MPSTTLAYIVRILLASKYARAMLAKTSLALHAKGFAMNVVRMSKVPCVLATGARYTLINTLLSFTGSLSFMHAKNGI
jgi:hypothetical protein